MKKIAFQIFGFLMLTGVCLWFYILPPVPAAKSIGIFLGPLVYVSAIYFGIIWLLEFYRLLYPAKKPVTPEEMTRLQPEFPKLVQRELVIGWVGLPLSGIILYFLFLAIASLRFSLIQAVYVLPIENSYWGILALMFSMVLTLLIWIIIQKKSQNGKYLELEEYSYALTGARRRYNPITRFIVWGLVVITFIGTWWIGLNTYTTFSETGIFTRSIFHTKGVQHSYEDVVSIKHRITEQENHIFIINFDDGASWKSPSFNKEEIPNEYEAAIEYAGKQSGIKIEVMKEKAK